MLNRKAVVLLSGGLDSSTCLTIAKNKGFSCYALSFDYGQKQKYELEVAKQIAINIGVKKHKIISINGISGSALTDDNIQVPNYSKSDIIPITYVPARNAIFLTHALGFAETINAWDIFIGVNAVDYSGYPDCRPEFIEAYTKMANLATKGAITGQKTVIHTPLIKLNKAEIIKLGQNLNVNYSKTISCYQANKSGKACGKCDACVIRKQGFAQANIADPTLYY